MGFCLKQAFPEGTNFFGQISWGVFVLHGGDSCQVGAESPQMHLPTI